MDNLKQPQGRSQTAPTEHDALVAAIEYLKAEMTTLRTENEELRELNRKVLEENKRLRERLAKNSSNSSKPPSSDGPSHKPKPKNLRKKKGRRPGGQPGREGKTLKQVENPDHTEKHSPEGCACGCDLRGVQAFGVEKRQVADIPPIKIEFTEHVVEIKVCPRCGLEVKGVFPAGVESPVQYGKRIQAFAAYLMNYQLLPFARTAELFEDLFGVPVSEGSLGNFRTRLTKATAAPVELIKNLISNASVAGFDESGMSVKGKTNWLHVASTVLATYYAIHPKRGSEAMDEIGILPNFDGVAVHDHWSSYYKYDCAHAECNAHILRSLKFLEEERGQKWAGRMSALLVGIKELVEQASETGASRLDEAVEEMMENAYVAIIKEGFDLIPPPVKPHGKRGRPKKSKERRMLEFLSDFQDQVLHFMRDFNVPFDNNGSERDVRMNKVKQKISGTFRSDGGSREWCDIRSYISTARKNGMNVIQAIFDAFNGNPFMPVKA